MMHSRNTQAFQDFLHVVVGSREVGLVLARDNDELKFLSTNMEESGFVQSAHATDLGEFPKTYILGSVMNKKMYDFVVQYPTGSVEIFDKKTMQSRIIHPNYSQGAVVVVVTMEDMKTLEENGFDIRTSVGITYQS